MGDNVKVLTLDQLPQQMDKDAVYRLLPQNVDEAYYKERTDRNIGWISEEEQQLLRKKTVGISGCGGMGGLIAQILVRIGIGTLKIADNGDFDASNINRQFGATRSTINVSKAQATAKALRNISDDNELWVYPQGICEASIEHFLDRCDVVCDEIEFWAIGARILLHQKARERNIPIFNANTAGFGVHLFFYTSKGTPIEESLGMEYEEANYLEKKIAQKTATKEEIDRVMKAIIRGLIPEFPEYTGKEAKTGNKEVAIQRLFMEGKAPIIGTNPPMATGFLADHVLLYLLKDSGIKRNVQYVPEMPGYLYFDVAHMEAKVVTGKWWQNDTGKEASSKRRKTG